MIFYKTGESFTDPRFLIFRQSVRKLSRTRILLSLYPYYFWSGLVVLSGLFADLSLCTRCQKERALG